jgi:hypothetical protein
MVHRPVAAVYDRRIVPSQFQRFSFQLSAFPRKAYRPGNCFQVFLAVRVYLIMLQTCQMETSP